MYKSILYLLFIFILTSCDVINGDGNIIIQDRGVFESYNTIYISGSFDVIATSVPSSNDQKVIIKTDENIQELIEVFEKNGILYIDQKKNIQIKPTEMSIQLYTPTSITIENSGSGNSVLNGSEYGDLKVNNSGSGDFLISANVRKIDLHNSGSGNSTLKGIVESGIELYNSGSGDISILTELEEIQMNNSGSGNINASSTKSKQITVNNSGSGICKVEANDQLYVIISGSGNVYYKGNPEIIKDITGSGDLKKLK